MVVLCRGCGCVVVVLCRGCVIVVLSFVANTPERATHVPVPENAVVTQPFPTTDGGTREGKGAGSTGLEGSEGSEGSEGLEGSEGSSARRGTYFGLYTPVQAKQLRTRGRTASTMDMSFVSPGPPPQVDEEGGKRQRK